MDKERKEYRKRMEERITADNSGKAIFIPQCNKCVHSSNRIYCAMYDLIPDDYRTDKKKCPMFKERK